VTLSATKLRAVVNMLSDPGSAANAASILAREAKDRGLLVADLVAQTIASTPSVAPPPPEPAAPSTAPTWQDVEPIDDGGPYVQRLGQHIGLVGVMVAETPKGADAWLPKSQVENHGEDTYGRGIFIIPTWLAKRGNLL
jgi:hypothetical protein